MKRKLLCIFFMLVGAAALVGTILLSFKRSEYADASPVITLIILSIATMAVAEWYMNREPYTNQVSGREKAILWAFRAVNILATLVCLTFVVLLWFLTRDYTNWMKNVWPLMVLAAAGITAASLGLKDRPPINIERGITKAAVALLISTLLVLAYVNELPKYSLNDGINMLRSKQENADKDVYDFDIRLADSYIIRGAGDNESFGPNPFLSLLYEYGCDSVNYNTNGLQIKKGYIHCNPANGANEYLRTQEQDLVFSPGEWPEFSWHFLNDRDGQHNAVLNLYFRQLEKEYPDTDNLMFTVGADEWDVKLKDTLYPHNFPEDEARSFLQSIGEEELKAKLLKQINDMAQAVVIGKKEGGTLGLVVTGTKGKTVEVYFFGIDIATYQNGEIVLKR